MNTNIISGNNAASPNSPEPLVGFAGVTRHLGVSKRTIQYHMKRGLPNYPLGRLIRFRLSEIDRWVATKLCISSRRRENHTFLIAFAASCLQDGRPASVLLKERMKRLGQVSVARRALCCAR